MTVGAPRPGLNTLYLLEGSLPFRLDVTLGYPSRRQQFLGLRQNLQVRPRVLCCVERRRTPTGSTSEMIQRLLMLACTLPTNAFVQQQLSPRQAAVNY